MVGLGRGSYADGRAGRGTAGQVALWLVKVRAWSQCWILGNLGKGLGSKSRPAIGAAVAAGGRGAWSRTGAGWDWAGREGEGGGARPRQVPGKQADRQGKKEGEGKRREGKGREGATEKLQETAQAGGLAAGAGDRRRESGLVGGFQEWMPSMQPAAQ